MGETRVTYSGYGMSLTLPGGDPHPPGGGRPLGVVRPNMPGRRLALEFVAERGDGGVGGATWARSGLLSGCMRETRRGPMASEHR